VNATKTELQGADRSIAGRIKLFVQFPVNQISVGIGFSTIEGMRLVTHETDYPDALRINGSARR
jgi:hypothetical protein